jgi:hypothetical protein
MTKSRMVLSALVLFSITLCSAQGVLGKLKQKATQAGEKALEKKVQQKTGTGNNQNTNTNTNQNTNSNDPTNKGGGGLVMTPPDVAQNITDANTSFKSGNYSEARYAIKQAMLGVEMEIGQNVLKSLPETVSGLKKDAEADQVTSMGAGWVGLTIHREYENGDKQLRVEIANNAAWMSAYNAYMANANYASTGTQQNWKQTKVKGYKGIIEYSDASGYKLSVPLGQSSLIVWEGINFASEAEMMAAANSFDIDGIKKTLGEK